MKLTKKERVEMLKRKEAQLDRFKHDKRELVKLREFTEQYMRFQYIDISMRIDDIEDSLRLKIVGIEESIKFLKEET